ncbi:DNA processing protein DprA [Parapedobacter pyrenivorans]|uniref:DNA processing protein DprA n=1 Tax=Parapedobacter pyrenivorans TaxID=1305674 RepID=A0A917MCF3_9SPHI|nr:DNA-processing protein DprA [Parapedobacter pyrenivorans]GGG95092.1 DNA processing protein DprA [Parapedobacter pyrenivorans]
MSLLYQIALTKVNGVGPVAARHLISHFGNAEPIFSASKKQLVTIPGIGMRLADNILAAQPLREAEIELRFVEKHNIEAIFCENKKYPKRLAECPDAPILLYYKGNTDLNPSRTISIVGTRNATAYGKSICAEFIKALVPYEVTIISGLAYGIDSYAHRNALAQGIPTVGVLGHGLDRIYPAANREMAAKMIGSGGLLTEFSSGTNPDKQNFPMRNRIIAGLADVTVVVEAAAKGGALITAEIANTYNRDVCAFPGKLDQEFSAGCNYLIKTNRAHLITGAKDLQYLMNWELAQTPVQPKQLALPVSLDTSEQQAYATIQTAKQVTIDELSRQLQWPQSKLAIILLQLEMKGIIVALPGKVYRIK